MINSLTIGARIKAVVTTKKGRSIHINVYTGTVTGFAENGNVKYKDDYGKNRTCSAANCKVTKPAAQDEPAQS
jgi:hypothetical protein